MTRKIAKLLQKTEYFYKLAGLLEVPERLLQEAENVIVGSYCQELMGTTARKLRGNKEREKSIPQIEAYINMWRSIENSLGGLMQPYFFESSLKELVEASSKTGGLVIPYFRRRTEDHEVGLRSIWQPDSPPVMNFSIKPTYNGKYHILLYINYPMEDEIITEDIDATVPTNKIRDILTNEVISKITAVIGELGAFNDHFEIYSDIHRKDLELMYGYCKRMTKHADLLGLGTLISVSCADVPYLAKRFGDRKVNLMIVLITSERHAKDIDPTEWLGLWEKWINEKQNFIGTAYVKVNLKQDIENINSFRELEDKISVLKETVRHELQHFMQDFISYVLKSKEDGGLPSKRLRDPNVTPSGQIRGTPRSGDSGKLPQTEYENIMEKDDPGRRIIHPLRDVEFYTRLSDEVDAFNRLRTYIPTPLQRDFMLAWVGHITYDQMVSKVKGYLNVLGYKAKGLEPSKYNYHSDVDRWVQGRYFGIDYYALRPLANGRAFFKELKAHQPAKYVKAVAEFSKAVGL